MSARVGLVIVRLRVRLTTRARPRNDSGQVVHASTLTLFAGAVLGQNIFGGWPFPFPPLTSPSSSLPPCKSVPSSRQITAPAPHHSVFFRPDALPTAQPTASNH